MADLFWLSDEQWAVLEPFMPRNQPGARRVDDRRVISGIVDVLKTGGRWRDCPIAYGPHTAVYNRPRRSAALLALQLRSGSDVGVLCGGLVGALPARPGDDVSGPDTALSQAHGHAPDLLDRPADQAA